MEVQEKSGMKFLRIAPCVMPVIFAVLTWLCYLLPAATLIGISMGNVYALAAEGEPFARLLLWSGIAVTGLGAILTAVSFMPAVKESKKNNLWGSEWIAYISALLYLIALIVDIIATVKIKDLMIFSTGVGVILAIVLAVVFLILAVVFALVWRKKNGGDYELKKAQERFDAYKAEEKPLQMDKSTNSMIKLSELLKEKCIQCIWQWILFALCVYLFVCALWWDTNTVVVKDESGVSASVGTGNKVSFREYCGLIIALVLGVVCTVVCVLKQTWALKRVKADVWGYVLLFLTLAASFIITRVVFGSTYILFVLILLISKFATQKEIKKIVKAENYQGEKVYVEEMKKYREYQSFKRAEYALGEKTTCISE